MRTAQGPFPMETSYRYEPLAGRRHARDAAQPRHPERLLPARRAVHGHRDASRHQQGPKRPQGRPRAWLARGSRPCWTEAEAEFASAGFQHGSLRKIMREAGVDPGAVHYHFGGREALAAAVLDRILAPLNARRLELLDAAVAKGRPRTAAARRGADPAGHRDRPRAARPVTRPGPSDRRHLHPSRRLRRRDRRQPLRAGRRSVPPAPRGGAAPPARSTTSPGGSGGASSGRSARCSPTRPLPSSAPRTTSSPSWSTP